MFDLVVPASLAVVVLALISAAAWGTSDFGGGALGRRSPILGVLVVTQGAGLLIAVPVMIARDEPLLQGPDLMLGLGGGLLAVVGIGSLYGGLAIGRMGVVAPVAAVLTAITPALIGIALEGAPQPIAIAGMVLAIGAVVVVSRVADHAGADRPSGLSLAIAAGVSLGLLSFVLSRFGDAYLLAPLAALRGVQVVVFTAIIVLGRRAWRLPRSSWPLALGVGAMDLAGNAAFISAARIELAPAAVLSSLYPIVTVLLAATILHERMTRSHVAGILLALAGVAMIAGGVAAGP
ncbi:MAG TPA: DMT family transporter [Candidatus Limnocylindrales bacterium]|nr:DMT family transporter [Candidatus Limnocylindrales bacterium]